MAWDEDPASGTMVSRPVPNLSTARLAFSFAGPAPVPAIYRQGTPEFRYWATAEALRRGADFWSGRVSSGAWQMGKTLRVFLDDGEDLNAGYDRTALRFYHGDGPSGIVYSAESPDVACHELGHAILDSIKPELWNAASDEVAAFHESFGDISALLSALQLPSLRTAILADTKGRLYRTSRLSRLAEQLGSAIRLTHPDAVESDCLRSAVNSFVYASPISLPVTAPASQLSSEAHSFSRVFTGAFFECVAGLLAVKAAKSGAPTEQELLQAGGESADLLVVAIRQAPVVANFYSQVAANMVAESAKLNSNYPATLKGIFIRRAILSLQSATHVEALHGAVVAIRRARGIAADQGDAKLNLMALPGTRYGLDAPIFVQTASQHRHFVAEAATAMGADCEPPSSPTVARKFVDDLFRRGSVDYGNAGHAETKLGRSRRVSSHQIQAKAGAHHLERLMFDCGFGPD